MKPSLAFSTLVLIPALFAGSPAAASVTHNLPEFSARYAITKFGIKLAEADYRLHYTDTGYRMTQQTRLYGMAALFRNDTVSASSIVDKVAGQLRLKKFTYRQTGKEKNRDETLSFHYRQNGDTLNTRIDGVSRSRNVDITTEGPVWDVLSFQIPLMIEARPSKKQYPYMAVLGGELDQYTFKLEGKKNARFAGKQYSLLEVVRRDSKKKRALHIWLAPALNNLPMIIENYRDGELHSRMQLERVQFDQHPALQGNVNIDGENADQDFDE